MGVRIITDSACDMTQEEAKKYGITIMPIRYRIGDEEFLDGITITNQEFYEKLERDKVLPKTSQITPYTYAEEYQKAIDNGDEVVCLPMSSGVSGCYQSACMGAADFEGKVFVFDSKEFCVSLRVMLIQLARLRDEGYSAKELYDMLPKILSEVRLISLFDTLEYLREGGRISRTVSLIGGALNIKPFITITDGFVDVIKPIRGSKKGFIAMKKYVEANGGIDFDRPYCVGYTGTSDDMIRKFLKRHGEELKLPEDIDVVQVGTTVGTYAGPGAIVISYFAKQVND